MSDIGLKVNPQGNSEYDYQDLLERGSCYHCAEPLNWTLVMCVGNDDRICEAACCGTLYSMVPSRVRVVGQLEATSKKHKAELADYLEQSDAEVEAMCDEDFIKELQKLQ